MEATTQQTAFPAAVVEMVKPWLTGDNEQDAQRFRRCFRMVGMSIEQWRQLVEVASQ